MLYVSVMLERSRLSKYCSIEIHAKILRWACFQVAWNCPHVSYHAWGKTMTAEVEVVDTPIDYNLLLG